MPLITLLWLVLLIAAIVLLVSATVVDFTAARSRDFLRFEARAVLSQRLQLAALALILTNFLIGLPIIGLALLGIALLWTLWLMPPSHRTLEVGAQTVFRAPPHSVAAVMFDVSQQPRWMQPMVGAELETPGLLRTGSVIRQTVPVGGHELVARLRVTTLEPGRRLVLTLMVDQAQPADVIDLQPHQNGTLVTYRGGHRLTLSGAILGGWRLPWLRRRFNARRAANLERVRPLVEAIQTGKLAAQKNSPRDVPAG
jgi:uncharacterized protein YndB with AHSA1/START domain